MDYKLNLGEWSCVFAVPKSVVEKHMKLAKEDFLKVLLIFLSHAGENLSNADISEKSGVSPENVADALSFWQQRGVLKLSEEELLPSDSVHEEKAELIQKDSDEAKSPYQKRMGLSQDSASVTEQAAENVKIRLRSPARLTGFELSKRIDSADELKWMISEAEKLFGRFLTPVETSTLISMVDYASISSDVIIMIIEYCASIEKINMRFIEKTAYSWIDMGFDTHTKVEAHITELANQRVNENIIKSAFGIWDRNLTTNQKAYISVWLDEWGFSADMLKLAYEICSDNTGKLSFPYINKILVGWHEKGLMTVESVDQNEKMRAESKKNVDTTFKAEDFDNIDEYTVPDLKKKKS